MGRRRYWSVRRRTGRYRDRTVASEAPSSRFMPMTKPATALNVSRAAVAWTAPSCRRCPSRPPDSGHPCPSASEGPGEDHGPPRSWPRPPQGRAEAGSRRRGRRASRDRRTGSPALGPPAGPASGGFSVLRRPRPTRHQGVHSVGQASDKTGPDLPERAETGQASPTLDPQERLQELRSGELEASRLTDLNR